MKAQAVAGIVLLMVAVSAMSQPPPQVMGDYVEVRSCYVYTCGCFYSGESLTAGREAILAWRIREGSLNGTPLSGVSAVAVIVGEENLSVGRGTRKSVLYLDAQATEAQRQAVSDLLRQRCADLLGRIAAIRVAPISFSSDKDGSKVAIGDTAKLSVRRAKLPEDAHPGSTLWYQPFLPMTQSTLGTALHHQYWGDDLNCRWRYSEPAISAYFGTFAL